MPTQTLTELTFADLRVGDRLTHNELRLGSPGIFPVTRTVLTVGRIDTRAGERVRVTYSPRGGATAKPGDEVWETVHRDTDDVS